jgi:hypothetical protein
MHTRFASLSRRSTLVPPIVCLLAAGLLAACGGSRSRGRGSVDMGPPPPPPPADAGLGDGPVVMVDMFVPTDLGTDLGGPGRPDMGDCFSAPLTYASRQCSSAVTSCIRSCPSGDDACVNDCVDSEEACAACITNNAIKCFNDSGCQRDWEAFDCCFQANCSASTDPMCAQLRCGAARSAYLACRDEVVASDPPCLERQVDCLAL